MNNWRSSTKNMVAATAGLAAMAGASTALGEDSNVWNLSTLAPNVELLVEGAVFSGGQSENIGPMFNQIWLDASEPGCCPVGTDDYSKCDDLRFGLSSYPMRDGGNNQNPNCITDSHLFLAPTEDGSFKLGAQTGGGGNNAVCGGGVSNVIGTIQNSSDICHGDYNFSPLAESVKSVNERAFPAGTETSWYERPNLTVAILDRIPQITDTNFGHQVTRSLQEACLNLFGREITHDLSGVTDPVLRERLETVGRPAMPLWSFVPKGNTDIVTFSSMMSAAGGTAMCCERTAALNEGNVVVDGSGNIVYATDCDPAINAFGVGALEDVHFCDHINETVTSLGMDGAEAFFRQRMARGEYNCGPGESVHQTGPMWAPALSEMRCVLSGSENGWCTEGSEYDYGLFGILKCVRQLPPETSYEELVGIGDDDQRRFSFYYRPDDSLTPVLLTERTEDNPDGNIEFIDKPRNRMFVLVGDITYTNVDGDEVSVDACGVVDRIEVNTCREIPGTECAVAGQTGRCATGLWECLPSGVDYCRQQYFPMPEICNGLDDDCTGPADNLESSSATPIHQLVGVNEKRFACHGRDICVCANGPDPGPAGYVEPTNYTGQSRDEAISNYLATHTNECECVTTLEDEPAGGASLPVSSPEPKVACTATPTHGQGALGGAALFFLAMAGAFGWRRRRS